MKIGLFWGSDTGVTEEMIPILEEKIGPANLDVHNVFDASIQKFEKYDYYILALSTWYDGELQSDWEEFLKFKKLISQENI